MRKIIFLDIDGVLATPECVEHGMWALVDSKQKLLKEILDRTGAKIVLSSSWRYASLFETKKYMAEKGFWFIGELIDVTIRARQHIKYTDGVNIHIPRGVEIEHWIQENLVYPWKATPELQDQYETFKEGGSFKSMRSCEYGVDYTYAIIDDDSDMLLKHANKFVKTKWDVGLTSEHVEHAIKILNDEI